jgi:prophage regulatory protein
MLHGARLSAMELENMKAGLHASTSYLNNAARELGADPSRRDATKLIDYHELRAKKGLPWCRNHLRRKVKDGSFPAPVALSESRIAWIEAEIDDWIRERAAMR